ncbi:hypothetical protein BGW39_003205 [Mortierella sp. 14UC]|nr:hypothetical protein BGW39_003205 [Mortierella sp. 14UC]
MLNTRAAVKGFTTGGDVTLGGNLFVSIEGSIIVERKNTNEAFYRAHVTAADLLSGAIPQPPQADVLYRALSMKASNGTGRYSGTNGSFSLSPRGSFYRDEHQQFSNHASPTMHSPGGVARSANTAHSGRVGNSQVEPGGPGNSNAGGYVGLDHDERAQAYRTSSSLIPGLDEPVPSYTPTASTQPVSKFSSQSLSGIGGEGCASRDNSNPFSASQNPMNISIANNKPTSFSRKAPPPPPPPPMSAEPSIVTALYDYSGEQATDLSFRRGDRITIVKKTECTNDWWTGKLNGRESAFPANYVQ